MDEYTVYAVFGMIVLVSFLGFLVENIWLSVTKGYVDNRGMSLPFLLGYGLAIMFIFFVLGTPQHPAAWLGNAIDERKAYLEYFVCVFLIVSAGEIVLGKTVEKVCGFYYWDYSRLPMHVTRYTSVPTSMMFTIIITYFMGHFFIPVMEWFSHIRSAGAMAFSLLAVIVLIVDYLSGFWYMIKNGKLCCRYKIQLKKGFRESYK